MNELTMIYQIDENIEKIRILDEIFVENNKDNCKIVIDGKEKEICTELEIPENLKNKKLLEIKLIEYKTITDMMCMFAECTSLLYLPNFNKWDTSNVTNLRSIFFGCSSLSLPDISIWNTNNVINMKGVFNGCSLLTSLPDISKWNTDNVKDMCNLFARFTNLKTLPDISIWNTSNVTNMSSMFSDCSLLISLPDISKWNTSNVTNMNSIF